MISDELDEVSSLHVKVLEKSVAFWATSWKSEALKSSVSNIVLDHWSSLNWVSIDGGGGFVVNVVFLVVNHGVVGGMVVVFVVVVPGRALLVFWWCVGAVLTFGGRHGCEDGGTRIHAHFGACADRYNRNTRTHNVSKTSDTCHRRWQWTLLVASRSNNQ